MSVTHEAVIRNPFNQGHVISGVVIGTTSTEVAHLLDRAPLGCIPFNLTAGTAIWKPAESARPHLTVLLQASAPVTCDIFVF